MAYVIRFLCRVCGEEKEEAISSGSAAPCICNACTSKKKDRERVIHFNNLDHLSIEERLRRVEEWIYDHKQSVKLTDTRY